MTVILSSNAEAAFLGLALGDAYGRPLEFVSGERVRTTKVQLDSTLFMWTDDTHMSLYLADAVLQMPQDRFQEEEFGHLVGSSFSLWFEDPLMPSTAPGNTCLAGVRNYREINDWRHSGVKTSDGCGSVMRICPLGISYSGEILDKAAEISSLITHAHPNAVATCVAASRILRKALETGLISKSYISQLADEMEEEYPKAIDLPKALRAAIKQANQADLEWLDEEAIPAGDGGWRAPSCLGLALTAVLRWGHNFATAIDKAARINGDSDSVACLAGMFIGAAKGLSALPSSWLSSLPMREDIRKKAQQLLKKNNTKVISVADKLRLLQQMGVQFSASPQLGQNIRASIPKEIPLPEFTDAAKTLGISIGETPNGDLFIDIDRSLIPADIRRKTDPFGMPEPRAFVHTQSEDIEIEDIIDVEPISPSLSSTSLKKDSSASRTSLSHPIEVNWIISGIGKGKGRFGITFAPGKKGASMYGKSWDRTLSIDLNRLKALYEVDSLISLIETEELTLLQIPTLVSEANQRKISVLRSPVVDGSIPKLEQALSISQFALSLANGGQRVVFHCRGGLGRAGTLTACALTHLGLSAKDAIVLTRKHRPGAIENTTQEKFVHQYYAFLSTQNS